MQPLINNALHLEKNPKPNSYLSEQNTQNISQLKQHFDNEHLFKNLEQMSKEDKQELLSRESDYSHPRPRLLKMNTQ